MTQPVAAHRFRRTKIAVLSTAALILVVAAVLLAISRDERSTSASSRRLHQIGLAIILYQSDHNQDFPTSLSDLLRAEKLDPDLVYCPDTSGVRVPFVWLGWPGKNPPLGTIVAYTPPAYYDGRGVDALMEDGSGMWFDPAGLQKALDERQRALADLATTMDTTAPTSKDRP